MIYSSALSVQSPTTPAPFSILKNPDDFIYGPLAFSKYGSSDTKAKFPDHTTIDVPFSGSLRPIQKDVVNISRKLITALGQNDCPDVRGGKTAWTIYHPRSGSENF
jgi:hypothetical protein